MIARDLPDIACRAAAEIDRLNPDRATDCPAMRVLADRLDEALPEGAGHAFHDGINLDVLLVVHGTLGELRLASSDNVADVVIQGREVARSLRALAADPFAGWAPNAPVRRGLKEFCLSFSRRAMGRINNCLSR